MNKRELGFLERVFAAEIDGALAKHEGIYQERRASKLASKLIEDGYIKKVTVMDSGVRCEGYRLTPLGHLTYCISASPLDAQ